MLFEHFRDARSNREGFNYNPVAPADYFDWRAQTHGFEDMAAWRWCAIQPDRGARRVAGTGDRARRQLEPVSAAGRAGGHRTHVSPRAKIVRTETAVMLTWNLFERRFGGDRVDCRQADPSRREALTRWWACFRSGSPIPMRQLQLWVPYAAGLPPELLSSHDRHFSHVVARLRPDVSLASAMSQVGAVQYRLHLQYLNAPVAEDVASKTINDDLARDVKKPLLILMCAVACMLLIGCLNVANLLVARGAARQKEVAIRGALGAQRLTLIRAQLTESLLICLAGGASGVLLSLAATKWLASAWKDLPSAAVIRVDGVVLGFACAAGFFGGAARRSAAGHFVHRQGGSCSAPGLIAHHQRKRLPRRAAQDAADCGDRGHRGVVDRRRAVAQEFCSFAWRRRGMRNQQCADSGPTAFRRRNTAVRKR